MKISHMQPWHLLLLIPIAVLLAGNNSFASENSHARPNILLIVLDDFGYNDLGANGNPEAPTPNLDTLAAQGIRYTRHYADATCSAARAAILTGKSPAAAGLRPAHLGLSKGTPTIASALSQAGYRTQHIGKWHVSNATLEQSPTQLGFDNWFGFLFQHELGGPSPDGITFEKPTYINPWLRDNQSPPKQYSGHLEDILTERAIQYLDQQKGKPDPWFLNLWYYAPHSPIEPAARFRKKHPATPKGAYYALIEQLDYNVGLVMNALERNGLAENTLVIVLSDNGGTNKQTDNNSPYFGKKTEFNEGGTRTPMFMRWPGHIAPAAVSDELVSIYDIFPTLAQVTSAKAPPELVGRNLLSDKQAAPPQLYWEYANSRNYTYSTLSPDGRWRLSGGSYVWQTLHDLSEDPTGKSNVIASHPEIAAKLFDEYLRWRMATREVDFSYDALNNRGGAVLRGNDLQRSPGYSGFSFAIGVTPAAEGGTTQVIAEQSDRWRLQLDADRGLLLDVLGNTIAAPPLTAGQCHEVVIASEFTFSPMKTSVNRADIDLFIDGAKVGSVEKKNPPLLTGGYANPTYIGVNAHGEELFSGVLSRPLILNERVVPDAEAGKIANGISGVSALCQPHAAKK
jgi:arylsulfatase A-like enzyme